MQETSLARALLSALELHFSADITASFQSASYPFASYQIQDIIIYQPPHTENIFDCLDKSSNTCAEIQGDCFNFFDFSISEH